MTSNINPDRFNMVRWIADHPLRHEQRGDGGCLCGWPSFDLTLIGEGGHPTFRTHFDRVLVADLIDKLGLYPDDENRTSDWISEMVGHLFASADLLNQAPASAVTRR